MIAPEPLICRRLSIRGRVQGVCFRDWATATARELGLAGWVRNRMDGSVEALVVGAPPKVETFVSRCREGPSSARVDDVEISHEPPVEIEGFGRRPTA